MSGIKKLTHYRVWYLIEYQNIVYIPVYKGFLRLINYKNFLKEHRNNEDTVVVIYFFLVFQMIRLLRHKL